MRFICDNVRPSACRDTDTGSCGEMCEPIVFIFGTNLRQDYTNYHSGVAIPTQGEGSGHNIFRLNSKQYAKFEQ